MEGQLSSRYVSYNPAILIGTTGLPEYEATIIPELCINGELGGICSRGVGMSTADLGCSSFFQTPVGFFSKRGKMFKLIIFQSHHVSFPSNGIFLCDGLNVCFVCVWCV